MGQPMARGYMCCSIRDKYGHGDSLVPSTDVHSFEALESEVCLDAPIYSAFAPLHQKASLVRRIAIASRTEVQVYRVPDLSVVPLTFELTHKMVLANRRIVTGVLFPDESSARSLAIAFGPESTSSKGHVVRVWGCQTPAGPSPDTGRETDGKVVEWSPDEGFSESLEEHAAHIRCMAASRSYLVTADDAGECRVWAKGRASREAFTRSAAHCIHPGGVADLTVDRLYAYSIGREDRRLCVWGLPSLTQVIAIPIAVDLASCFPFNKGGGELPPEFPPAEQVSAFSSRAKEVDVSKKVLRLTHLRRPLSRWAGWQGSSRGPKVPRGLVFLAGVLDEPAGDKDNGGPGGGIGGGLGVLMEYSLGVKPACRSMQIAHDAPITCLIYGPYDNGPLLTADEKGVFRVWNLLLEKGPRFSQQIELLRLGSPGQFTVCVEQPEGLYVAASGGRLFLWRKQQELEQAE